MNKKFSLLYIPNAVIDLALITFLYFKAHIGIAISICVFVILFVVYFSFNFYMNALYVKDIQKFYKSNKYFSVSAGLFCVFIIIESFTDISLLMAFPFMKTIFFTCVVWAHHAKTDTIQYHESELEKRNKK